MALENMALESSNTAMSPSKKQKGLLIVFLSIQDITFLNGTFTVTAQKVNSVHARLFL